MKIVLFHKDRSFRGRIYRYSLFRENEKINISIEEYSGVQLLSEEKLCDLKDGEEACLHFALLLANSLSFPCQLRELYEENDLKELLAQSRKL